MKKRDIAISAIIIVAALITFALFTQRTGFIDLDAPGAELCLRGGFFTSTLVEDSPEPTKVKARLYRPAYLRIRAEDGVNKWQANSYGPYGDISKISVAAGKTVKLKAGPPLLIKPSIQKSPGSVSISYFVIGQAGEVYDASILKNGKKIPAPKLQIVSEAGDVLASGTFEYG